MKTVCPNPGGFGEEFYSSGSRVGLLIRLGCVQGLHSSNLVSGNLLVPLIWPQGVFSGMKNANIFHLLGVLVP